MRPYVNFTKTTSRQDKMKKSQDENKCLVPINAETVRKRGVIRTEVTAAEGLMPFRGFHRVKYSKVTKIIILIFSFRYIKPKNHFPPHELCLRKYAGGNGMKTQDSMKTNKTKNKPSEKQCHYYYRRNILTEQQKKDLKCKTECGIG